MVRELDRVVGARRAVLTRVHVAHADAWQAEGRLRERHGGGARDVRGLRLMASGLPQAQWNSGDVTAPDADLDAARAFYADRGASWGLRVPAGMPWSHGRHVLTLRLMALEPSAFRPAPDVAGVQVREAMPADFEAVLAIDTEAFAADPAVERRWLEPHFDARDVTTALATLDGEPAGTGYAIRTDGEAGPALYLAGVAVKADARRRGVGAVLSSWLVETGLRDGARLAHLHADTDAAARVYARLGFADTPGLEVYVGV
jgi:GNAT superfamily N-acetyltransferase